MSHVLVLSLIWASLLIPHENEVPSNILWLLTKGFTTTATLLPEVADGC